MANLNQLRKRLKSINSTGEMASAMKTVASVKYSKLSKMLVDINDYSVACDEILYLVADAAFKRETPDVEDRNCYVVVSSNRGFCGGYNTELLRFLETELKNDNTREDALFVACGKKAQKYFEEKSIRAVSVDLSDIPPYEEAEKLTKLLLEIYEKGEARNIYLVYQQFVNMMTQKPRLEQILPHRREGNKEANSYENVLYIPDRETFENNLSADCLVSDIYSILIKACAGAQAATLIAMRNACDNAAESSQNLELMINRIRQAEVTNSVIETSSGMISQN